MKNLTTTPTVLRTLGLLNTDSSTDSYPTIRLKRNFVIVKTIDKSKSVKSISSVR